jgi:PKD repeat protein
VKKVSVVILIGVLCFSMFQFMRFPFSQSEASYMSIIQGDSTIVSGRISENTTWTLSGSPYIVEGDILVELNVFLTIEPGAVIRFGGVTSLIVDGTLIAQGNSTFYIFFSSNATSPAIGDWGTIRIRGGHGEIAYSVVEYASTGITFEEYATGSIMQSLIRINGVGIYSDWSNILIDCVNATGNSVAISSDGNSYVQPSPHRMTVQNSSIRGNGQGISHFSDTVVVRNCTISENNAGISATAWPTWTDIFDTEITDNTGPGMAGEGSGTYTTIHDCLIVNNTGVGVSSWLVSIYGSLVSKNNYGVTGGVVGISDSNITYNTQGGILASPAAINVIHSEVAHNGGFGISLTGVYETREIHYTNIYQNTGYAIANDGSNEINATYNWWGTTNETLIREKIYDYYDDSNLGIVLYKPYLLGPFQDYPSASFVFTPDSPVVNETVFFNASSSYDFFENIASYSWNFGDGTDATETEPITNHAYTIAETYTVTLNVTDSNGLANSSTQSVSVGKLNSAISISAAPTKLTIEESTIIDGKVTPTREGKTVTIWYRHLGEYTWSNLTVIATDGNSIYSYAWTPSEPGTYELKASWLGDENTLGAESSTITVTRLSSPVPSFTYSPGIPSVGAEMTFDASSSYDVNEDIASYRWDFDDGNISSTVTPIMVHTYVSQRTFNVTLTVIDTAGLNSSISQSVLVKMPTSISILTSSPSTFVGFKVNITGTIRDIYGNELGDETIVLYYTFSGISTWTPITSDITDNLGNYLAMWVPPATGYFEIKAEWAGNTTHLVASNTTTLSSLAYQGQYVFSVESNSTISEFAFDTNNWKLKFTATGPNGTMGYTKVTIAKSLVANITNVRIYLNNSKIEFSVTSTDNSWVLSFSYSHSTHELGIDLVSARIGDITGPGGQLDGKCDMRDIGLVARNFGRTVPPAPANCDLTGMTAGVPDGIIDMRDIGLIAKHYGDHYQ